MKLEGRHLAAALAVTATLAAGCRDGSSDTTPPPVTESIPTSEAQTGISALPDILKNGEALLNADAQTLLRTAFGLQHRTASGSLEKQEGALLDTSNARFGELMHAVTSAQLEPAPHLNGPGLIPLDDPGYTGLFSKRRSFRVPGTNYTVQDLNNDSGGHDRLIQVLEEVKDGDTTSYRYLASLQYGAYGKGTGKSQVVASVAIPSHPGLAVTGEEYRSHKYNPNAIDDVRNAEATLGEKVPRKGWSSWEAPAVTFPEVEPVILIDFIRTNGDVNGPLGGFYQEVDLMVTEHTGVSSTAVVFPTGAAS